MGKLHLKEAQQDSEQNCQQQKWLPGGKWFSNETKVAELLTAAEQARGEVGLGAEGNISSSLT